VYEWICRAPESYFISSGDASGVMTGRRTLMGISNNGGFSLDAKGLFNGIVFMIPNKDSLQVLRQGAKFCAYSARGKVSEYVQDNEDSYAQIRKVIKTTAKDKFSFHC
jgi:hypothetical protein